MMTLKALLLLLLAGSSFGRTNDEARGNKIVSAKKGAEEFPLEVQEQRRKAWDRTFWKENQYDMYHMDGMKKRGNRNKKSSSSKSTKKKKSSSNSEKWSFPSHDHWAPHKPELPSFQFIQSIGCPDQCLVEVGGDIVTDICDDCEIAQKWRTVGVCDSGKPTSSQHVQFQSAENPHKCIAVPPGTSNGDCDTVQLTTIDCTDEHGNPNIETIFNNADGIIVSMYCWNLGNPAILDATASGDCGNFDPAGFSPLLDSTILTTQQWSFNECLLRPTVCSRGPMWW